MAIHKINLKEMNFVSNENVEGTWENAFVCYGPGPKGIDCLLYTSDAADE